MSSRPGIVGGCELADLTGTWWPQHREASLNWLALGLLLAAWNATDNNSAAQSRRRPQALRGYPYVSVRAFERQGRDMDSGSGHTLAGCNAAITRLIKSPYRLAILFR